MADVNDLISRATNAINLFYGAQQVVVDHDTTIANLQAQIDNLKAEYPAKVADVETAREGVKAIFNEIIGANG